MSESPLYASMVPAEDPFRHSTTHMDITCSKHEIPCSHHFAYLLHYHPTAFDPGLLMFLSFWRSCIFQEP